MTPDTTETSPTTNFRIFSDQVKTLGQRLLKGNPPLVVSWEDGELEWLPLSEVVQQMEDGDRCSECGVLQPQLCESCREERIRRMGDDCCSESEDDCCSECGSCEDRA